MVVMDVGDIKGLDSIEKKLNWEKKISIFFYPGGLSPGLGGGSHISAPRKNFHNRLGAPESIHMRGMSPKNLPI